jgi:long-chain fatty acid transport protein
VHADGWKIQLQGAKALGASYAGRSVLTDDASVVWFNPAGLTELPADWVLTAGAPLITYQLQFRDTGSSSLLGQPMQGPASADGGTTAVVPHLYLARRLTDRWRFGFGFNAPYGLGTNYGETWSGRYHATETRLSVFNVNPTVAVRISDSLSAGFGLDVQRSTATLANMIDFGSIGTAVGVPLTPQGYDGRIEFKGFDWAAGWNGGLLWRTDTSRLGASFRSRIDHTLRGTADFTVPAGAEALTQGGRVFADTDARVTLPMPAELSVSASGNLSETWTLLGDVTWTNWSVFEVLRVDFDNASQPPVQQDASWDDSIRVAGGLRARAGPRWVVTGGVGYETTPVPDATRTARLPERAHTWLSGSASYTGTGRWRFDIHGSHLLTPDAPIALTDPAAGVLAGTVHWRLTVIGFGAVVTF